MQETRSDPRLSRNERQKPICTGCCSKQSRKQAERLSDNYHGVNLRTGSGTRGREGDTEKGRRGERGRRRKGDGASAPIRRFTDSSVLKEKGRRGRIMMPEWNGIEQRLERLKVCLLKLEPLKAETSDGFASDPYLDQE
jgi:hypothetical protein